MIAYVAFGLINTVAIGYVVWSYIDYRRGDE